MKKLIFKGAVLSLAVLMLGCSNKTGDGDKTKEKAEEKLDCSYTAEYTDDDLVLDYYSFIGTANVDGKCMYIRQNKPADDITADMPYQIDYYEFDEETKDFKFYKNLVTIEFSDKRRFSPEVLYYEKDNKVITYMRDESSKTKLMIFDLNNNSSEEVELEENQMFSSSISWADDKTVAFTNQFNVTLYNMENGEVKKINILDYKSEFKNIKVDLDTESSAQDLEHLRINYVAINDNLLKVTLRNQFYEFIVVINVDTNKLVNDGDISLGPVAEYYNTDNYIFICANGSYYAGRLDDLENAKKVEALKDNKFYTQKVYVCSNDTVCIITRDGIYKYNLESEELRKISDVTDLDDDILVRINKSIDKVLYLANKDYVYKFDKEKETLEPLAELNIFEHEEKSEDYGGVDHVYMFSDEAGFVQYYMFLEEPNSVTKNIKIYKK